jgi:MYXO-CTERM domain-containing protein
VKVTSAILGWWSSHPRSGDALLAAAVTGAVLVRVAVATEPDSRAPNVWAYLLAGLVGVALLGRRRAPVAVVVLSYVLLMAYHVSDFPAIGIAWPLGPALASAALAGHAPMAAAIVVGSTVGTASWRFLTETEDALFVLNGTVEEATAMGALVLAGYAVRGRRLLAEESRAREAANERARDHETSRRVSAERMRISRELHDIIAHTVALIGVQARVAEEAVDGDSPKVRAALSVISGAVDDAHRELKVALGVLRDDGPAPLEPAPEMSRLGSLLESIRTGGLPVEAAVDETVEGLPAGVQLTAYRVLQEALTNVVRHSGAGCAHVEVVREGGGLRLSVVDDGTRPPGPEGLGIAGMRERVASLGGRLEAGPRPDGGFGISAWIPAT